MKSTAESDGYLYGLFKEAVNEMLKAEMDNHLGYEKHSPVASLHLNSSNGKTKKTIKTTRGEHEIEVSCDREGSFEPQLIPKRKRVMEEIED